MSQTSTRCEVEIEADKLQILVDMFDGSLSEAGAAEVLLPLRLCAMAPARGSYYTPGESVH